VSGLALGLQEPRPQATQEVSWTIQPGYADVHAKADLKSRLKDVTLVHWAIPPEVTVADVRGADVDHWSRAADQVLVWLRTARKTTSLELSGWMAYPPSPGPRGGLVTLPSLAVKSAKSSDTILRVTWGASLQLDPEQLQNLVPQMSTASRALTYLAKQPSHRAVFRARPAPPASAPGALPKTKILPAPQPAAMPPVQILSAEQEAALGDGQRWIHQAGYRLLVSGSGDLRLHLPASATFMALTLDGNVASPRQAGAEALWVRLPPAAGPHRLCLRWVFPAGSERVDQPNLTAPRFEGLTAPAPLWIVHVPPLYEAKPLGEGLPLVKTPGDLKMYHPGAGQRETFLAMPQQGTPTYWAAGAGGQAPRLRLAALATRHVRRTMMASGILLIFLMVIMVFSRFPRLTAWVRKLWPEQLMLIAWLGCEAFGMGPLGVLLFTSGVLCRLAWLASKVQRRWHAPRATANA